jgi:hypothetical protein
MLTVPAIVGTAFIGFVLGAAVIKFDLPTSELLNDAFDRGETVFKKKIPAPRPGLEADEPGETFDGFTLYTTGSEPRVVLIDMKGKVVHDWTKPYREVWPSPHHVKTPGRDAKIGFRGCWLYRDGELLAVYEAEGASPSGHGLVKLDKDSKVLWKFADAVHDEVDVGEDGRIYVLSQKVGGEAPEGLEFLPKPYLEDEVVVLSPDGQELKRVPILEAFRGSEKYRFLLEQIRNQPVPAPTSPTASDTGSNTETEPPAADILHADSIHVLTGKLAPLFPRFAAGQVLISLRELNVLAVMDVDSGKVVWAVLGPWKGQHSARFIDNGHLLLIDNRGVTEGSRLIEYDPRTQSFPWSMPEKPGQEFHSKEGGAVQRLPNGNTFFIDSEGGNLREMKPDGHTVWHLRCEPPVPWGRRYGLDEVRFLEPAVRPRP